MLGHEIIHLLDLKNIALEDFATQNDLFIKLARKKTITLEHFKIFYRRREEILQKISKIDILVERACSYRETDFVNIDSSQTNFNSDNFDELNRTKSEVIQKQKIKKHWVTKIIEQDLEIMTMYAESNTSHIE